MLGASPLRVRRSHGVADRFVEKHNGKCTSCEANCARRTLRMQEVNLLLAKQLTQLVIITHLGD